MYPARASGDAFVRPFVCLSTRTMMHGRDASVFSTRKTLFSLTCGATSGPRSSAITPAGSVARRHRACSSARSTADLTSSFCARSARSANSRGPCGSARLISSVALSHDSVPGNRTSSSDRNWSTSSSGTGVSRDGDVRFKEGDREWERAEKNFVMFRASGLVDGEFERGEW